MAVKSIKTPTAEQKQARNAMREAQKEAQKEAKEQAAIQRRQVKRLGLPESFKDWSNSDQQAHVLSLDGFQPMEDKGSFDEVRRILTDGDSFKKIMSELSTHFGCARCEVCLVSKRGVRRNNQNIDVIQFRFAFNQEAMEIIKDAGTATFDIHRKAWNLNLDDAEEEKEVLSELDEHFAAIIDLDSMAVHLGPLADMKDDISRSAFRHLPFHIEVSFSEMLESIRLARPTDKIDRSKVYLQDGSSFLPLPETAIGWSRLPFLVLRYAVPNGRPRYVSYSTLSKQVEEIMFANDSRATQRGLARYMDSIRDLTRYSPDPLELPVLTTTAESLIKETPEMRASYYGPFSEFADELKQMTARVPSVVPLVMTSDYSTLMLTDHGADADRHGIGAYVHTTEKARAYHEAIAAFFSPLPGKEVPGAECSPLYYPVVFNRATIDHIAKSEPEKKRYDFFYLMAHEIAHWLATEFDNELGMTPASESHDANWAVIADALFYVYTGGRPAVTLARPYYIATAEVFEEAFDAITQPMLDSAAQSANGITFYQREDIKYITLKASVDALKRMQMKLDTSG